MCRFSSWSELIKMIIRCADFILKSNNSFQNFNKLSLLRFVKMKVGSADFHFRSDLLKWNGSAKFILGVQNLVKMKISGGFLISFQFCTERRKIIISDVLILFHITIRLKLKYSEVLFSFQSEEIIKITSSTMLVFHLFDFYSSIIKTTLVKSQYFVSN